MVILFDFNYMLFYFYLFIINIKAVFNTYWRGRGRRSTNVSYHQNSSEPLMNRKRDTDPYRCCVFRYNWQVLVCEWNLWALIKLYPVCIFLVSAEFGRTSKCETTIWAEKNGRSGHFDTRSLGWHPECRITFRGRHTDVVHISIFNYKLRYLLLVTLFYVHSSHMRKHKSAIKFIFYCERRLSDFLRLIWTRYSICRRLMFFGINFRSQKYYFHGNILLKKHSDLSSSFVFKTTHFLYKT